MRAIALDALAVAPNDCPIPARFRPRPWRHFRTWLSFSPWASATAEIDAPGSLQAASTLALNSAACRRRGVLLGYMGVHQLLGGHHPHVMPVAAQCGMAGRSRCTRSGAGMSGLDVPLEHVPRAVDLRSAAQCSDLDPAPTNERLLFKSCKFSSVTQTSPTSTRAPSPHPWVAASSAASRCTRRITVPAWSVFLLRRCDRPAWDEGDCHQDGRDHRKADGQRGRHEDRSWGISGSNPRAGA